MIQQIATYLATEWKLVLSVSSGFFLSTVAVTWAFARLYYVRQIEILKSKNKYLEKQLADKDVHIRGVMEIMGQRLLLAEEEPKQLKAHIQDSEDQINLLREENNGLLERIAATEQKEKFQELFDSLTHTTLRSNLRGTVSLYSKLFTHARSIRTFKLHFDRWDSETEDKNTNSFELAQYYSILSNIQLHGHKSLDIDFYRNKQLLRFERAKTYNALSEMLIPFLNNKSIKSPSLQKYENTAKTDIDYYVTVFGVPKNESDNILDSDKPNEDESNEFENDSKDDKSM